MAKCSCSCGEAFSALLMIGDFLTRFQLFPDSLVASKGRAAGAPFLPPDDTAGSLANAVGESCRSCLH